MLPIWVTGWINDKKIPRSDLKSPIWGKAEREVEGWHRDPEKREAKERQFLPIDQAIEKYLLNCKAKRNVADSTYVSYQKTLQHLSAFLTTAAATGIGWVSTANIL